MQLWPCLHVICIAVTIDRSRGAGPHPPTYALTIHAPHHGFPIQCTGSGSRVVQNTHRGHSRHTGRQFGKWARVCVWTRGAVWRACCWIEKDDDLPEAIGRGWTGGCGGGGGLWTDIPRLETFDLLRTAQQSTTTDRTPFF